MNKMKVLACRVWILFPAHISHHHATAAALLVMGLLFSFMLVPVLAQEVGDPSVGAKEWPNMPCIECHGDQAQGDYGPKIAGTGLSYAAVLFQVRHGGGDMPAFSEREVSDQQVADVYAWLQTFREQASASSFTVPYPVDNLLQFFSTVSEVKVRSDFAKDLPQRTAPDDPMKQLEILKQYVGEGLTLANTALGQGQAALNDIPYSAFQSTLKESMDAVRQIVTEGNAALDAAAFRDAWPHTAEMVRLSRLDAWPLAAQAVRQTSWVGQVVVKVTDQEGKPIPEALVTVLTSHNPVAAMADATGTAVLNNVAAVPALQVKAYADGLVYHEVHANVPAGGSVDVTIVLPGPSVGGQTPSVSAAAVNPASGAGNASVTFSVVATDPQGKLNLAEDQIFALNPEGAMAYILRDAGGDQWQSTVSLPGLNSGTHTFYLFAVDHQCNTSNIIPVTYTVP